MRTTESLASSAVASVTWDPDETGPQDVEVTFVNGRSYTHAGVPFTVVQGLVNAQSAGRYYASHMKGKYQQ